MEVKVRRSGMLSTIQDLGRPGQRAAGVPVGGAMDAFALRVANLLVGNTEDAAALEMTRVGAELEFGASADAKSPSIIPAKVARVMVI